MSKKPNIFDNAESLLTWLNKALVKEPNEALSVTLKVVNKIKVVYSTRGKHEAIKYSKLLRSSFIRYIFNNYDNPSDLPKILRPWKKLIKDSYWEYPLIRLFLSGLYLTRSIRLKAKPSFETIKNPTALKSVGDFDNLVNDMHSFLVDLGINPRTMGKVPKSLRFRKFHMSAKKGPNGPALWTSPYDRFALPEKLQESLSILGGPKFREILHNTLQSSEAIYHLYQRFHPTKGGTAIRRLVAIPDKEGKTREIAIGDYWSQTVLRPLNSKIFKLLSSISQDCTHEQDKHLCFLKKTSEEHKYHSIDLTAFSDRFPITIQKVMLRILYGPEYSEAWSDIMVGYPFDFHGDQIYYGTGNPMGMYSSWAVASLAHHFLIWKACKRANRNWRRCPYMLLGDDLVIADDNVAREYKNILQEWLIPYSPEKTHVSSRGYEFAKQIIIDDINVSPFPLAALFERRNSPIESVGIICRELWKKDWYPDLENVIQKYYLHVLGWKYPKLRKFFPDIMLTVRLLEYLSGLSNLGPSLRKFVEDFTKMKIPLSEERFNEFGRFTAFQVVKTLFEDSLSEIDYTEGSAPIGRVPQMFINELLTRFPDSFNKMIESQPIIEVSLDSTQAFLNVQKEIDNFGIHVSGKNLRFYIGKLDTPIKDRDIYTRNRDVVLVQALKSARIIRKTIKDHLVDFIRGDLDLSHPFLE
jgi:hypothetical protein